MKALILNIYCLFFLISVFASPLVQARSQHSSLSRRNHRRAAQDVTPPDNSTNTGTTKLVDPAIITPDPPAPTPTPSGSDSSDGSDSKSTSTTSGDTSKSTTTTTGDTSKSTDSASSSASDSASSSSSDSSSSSSSDSSSSSASSSPSDSGTPSSSDSASITPPPSSSASTDSSSPTSSTSDTNVGGGGGLSSILSSILSGILDPTSPTDSSTDSSSPTDSASNSDSQTSSTITDGPTSSTDGPTSPTSDSSSPSDSSSDSGIVVIPTSIVVTLSSTTISITVIPTSDTSGPTQQPSSDTNQPSSTPDPPPSSTSDQPPPSSTPDPPPSSVSTSDQPPPSSSSSDPISFPQGPSSDGVSTSVVTSTTTVISVPGDLSFILTESSLAQATDVTSTTLTQTLSNPDEATTTVQPTSAILGAASSIPTFVLPSGLPNRIYPNDGVANPNPDGHLTLISILFDQFLNWPFVANSNISASQIFGFLPLLIAAATGSSPVNFCLEVSVPASYTGPDDQSDLRTLYLAYVDPTLVDTLAAAIKDTNSAFYKGVQSSVAQQLAAHVIQGFSVKSIADPNANAGGGGGGGAGASNAGASSSDGKQRQDAIIGVVSALGAVAVLVLVFLVYRSLQRRRELNHRRLSDPPDDYIIGARPAGREFDQDSVGGQRRRSFYFAEDSLRDGQTQNYGYQNYDYTQVDRNGSPSPASGASGGMRERRVAPNAISAPVLQASSMNW